MGTITLSVPDELKSEMENNDFINWSAVARRAFVRMLLDFKEVELKKRVFEISEIDGDDSREVKESLAKEVVKSVEKASKELKSGKTKPMSLEDLDKLMGLK
jgi:hypothetical protein